MAALNVSSARFQIAALVVGAAVFALCTVFAVLGLRSIKTEQEAIEELETVIAALDRKISDIDRLQGLLDDLRRQFEIDRRILPDETEIERFIEYLYIARTPAGIPVGQVTPDKQSAAPGTREKKTFEKKVWTLRFIADFFQMAEFIDAIESYQRFIQVDSFDVKAGEFDPAAPPGETVSNDVTMKISTFIYNPPASETEGAAK